MSLTDAAVELHAQLMDKVAELRTSQDWLTVMTIAASMHDYSLGNWLLMLAQAHQRDTTITHPAGYRNWQRMGRQVRKGETGYRILAPMTRTIRDETSDGGDERRRHVVTGFRVVSVFDIAQTEGDPLPDVGPHTLTANTHGDLADHTVKLVENAGYTYRLASTDRAGLNGYTRPSAREVIVDSGLADAQRAKTTIHELAHVLLHADHNTVDCRGAAEVEAEAVAYIVTSASGLDTTEYSVAYVAGWAEHTDDPTDTLLRTGERIVSTARRILHDLAETPDRRQIHRDP